MLKRLKRNFVTITLVLTGIVLAVVLGSTLYSTWRTQHDIVDAALERGLNNDLDQMPTMGGPGGHISADDDGGPGARDGKNGDSGTVNLLALIVDVTSDGVVIKSSRAPVSIDADVLTEVVQEALNSDSDSGTIAGQHVAWRRMFYTEEVTETVMGTVVYESEDAAARIVLVDTSAMDEAFSAQLRNDVLISIAALLALLLIANFLSERALKPVEHAWEEQRRFVADASHELKTPLAVIIANTQILANDPAIPAESKRWVESTADEAGHMKSLVTDLLELARADESATDGLTGARQHEDIDFSELVDSATLEFDAIAFERGCEIESSIEEGIHVQGDREWLERVTKILIDNGCKYAAAGTQVEVKLRRAGQHAQLDVTNFGQPIDAENLPHVFERFYRTDKARARTTGGFGLGLAIAKSTVEAHGGKISVTSSEAAGTTFTVVL